MFFVAGGSAFSHINWFFGAALSFKLSTHYPLRGGFSLDKDKCGIHYISLNAGHTVSAWVYGAALSFKLIASYYPRRGGYSGRDDRSGAFCVYADGGFTFSLWYVGAALL